MLVWMQLRVVVVEVRKLNRSYLLANAVNLVNHAVVITFRVTCYRHKYQK